MSEVTIITSDAVSVAGWAEDDRVFIERAALEEATGWVAKPEGLCQGDICVPVRDRESLEKGSGIDVAALATAVGRRSVVDASALIAAISLDAADRQGALVGLAAPTFSLPDLDGSTVSLDDFAGTKRLLVTFSSWCGCRYDLPGWQALNDELDGLDFQVIAVALDDDPEVVRPFATGLTIPVLLDRQHLLSELYAISNVPTVVWIDEVGTIVRPNDLAFGTDTFADFTGVDSSPHLEAIRQWVRTGEASMTPEEVSGSIEDLSDEEIDARLHFRVGVEARRQGQTETAERHLRIAGELTPFDFSVRRAAMPLLGEDPFGQGFLDLYDEWREKGAPYHGLPIDAEPVER